MMKRIICALLTFSLLAGLLCGCGAAPTQAPEQSSTGEITIRWWAFPTFAQETPQATAGVYEKKVIKAFEAANPGIKVNLTMLDFTTGPEKLSYALRAKGECDVLFDAPGRIIEYGKAGYLSDLNGMFDDAFASDVNNSALLKACKDGETAYMYPLSSAPFYMAFNKGMLEDAGVLDLVKEGWTTKDFTTVVEALHEKGYVPGSVFCKDQGGDQGTRAFVANLFDSAITNPDATEYTIGNENGLKAIRYIKDCVDRGLLVNGTYMNGSDAIFNFVNGRASFSLLWGPSQQHSNEQVLAANDIEVVSVPYPSEDGVPDLEYLVNGFCVVNNGNAKKVEAAKKLIRFICDDAEWGPKNVVQTGCIPVRTSFGDLYSDATMDDVMNWTGYYATYYNTVDGFSTMRTEWRSLMKNVMNGFLSPEKALSIFAEKANASLK